MASRNNSYLIEGFYNPKREADRLDVRSRARLEKLVPQLESLGLKPSMRLLEVGSGTGVRSVTLAKYLKHGFVQGIDVSETLLERAKQTLKNAKIKNVKFEEMNVFDLQFEKNTFDFIYIRLVIQHLPNPVNALKELRRVLKPNGIIFLEDTDRDWMSIYPSNDRWDKIYEKVKRGQARNGGDPQCGRKLGSLLIQSGFKDVQTEVISVQGRGAIFKDWIENYAPTFMNNVGAIDRIEGFEVIEQLKKMNKKSPIFFNQSWFQAWGEK